LCGKREGLNSKRREQDWGEEKKKKKRKKKGRSLSWCGERKQDRVEIACRGGGKRESGRNDKGELTEIAVKNRRVKNVEKWLNRPNI